MGGAVARPKRRSANPRRHVPGPRPLRSRRPRRARPIMTGGDPAAPGRLPCAPQPPHEPRPSLRFGPWRRVGAPAPLRSGLRLRSLRSLRPGPRRPGARSVRALALCRPGRKSARGHQSCRNRLHGRRGGRSSSCRLTLPAAPTVAAERRSCPRAWETPVARAPCASRGRSLPYASRPAFRSFVAALRPRAAARQGSPCAGPSPRRDQDTARARRAASMSLTTSRILT